MTVIQCDSSPPGCAWALNKEVSTAPAQLFSLCTLQPVGGGADHAAVGPPDKYEVNRKFVIKSQLFFPEPEGRGSNR